VGAALTYNRRNLAMISNLNPYPKQPGFGRRVAYAKRALKQLARKPWSRLPVPSRAFDNCFENGDGTAVVWTLMQAARTDPELEQGIIWLDGGRGHLLKEWQRIYGFPMSVRPAFQQAAQPPVDLVSPVQ
jgi:hypothetical protein